MSENIIQINMKDKTLDELLKIKDFQVKKIKEKENELKILEKIEKITLFPFFFKQYKAIFIFFMTLIYSFFAYLFFETDFVYGALFAYFILFYFGFLFLEGMIQKAKNLSFVESIFKIMIYSFPIIGIFLFLIFDRHLFKEEKERFQQYQNIVDFKKVKKNNESITSKAKESVKAIDCFIMNDYALLKELRFKEDNDYYRKIKKYFNNELSNKTNRLELFNYYNSKIHNKSIINND